MTLIYALVCPLTEQVRYIGKTKISIEHRLDGHIKKAVSGEAKHYTANWIRKLHAQGLTPSAVEIFRVPEGESWQHHEMRLIREYREAGHPLTNSTGGGDGFHDVSDEVKVKRLASWRATFSKPGTRQRFSEAQKRSKDRPEVRRKMSASVKKAWQSEETKDRMMRGMRTDEGRANRSMATLRRYQIPGQREAQSEKSRAWAATPEGRAAILKASAIGVASEKRKAAVRIATRTPDYREKMRTVSAEIGARPDVAEKRSGKMKANWSDPEKRAARMAALTSAETKKKHKEGIRAAWDDPETAARLRAGLSSPERRAAVSKGCKERATPEYRAMMAERTRLAWIKRREKK